MCNVAEIVESAQKGGGEGEDGRRQHNAHHEGEHDVLTRILIEEDHRADEAQELESASFNLRSHLERPYHDFLPIHRSPIGVLFLNW